MFSQVISIILISILVLIFNLVYLYVGTYMWNTIHVNIIITGLFIKLLIWILGLFSWILINIRPVVLKLFLGTYRINMFRVIVCLLYCIFVIGILTIIRYNNIGREIDLIIVWQLIIDCIKFINIISDNWVLLSLNWILIIYILLITFLFFRRMIGAGYEYVCISFLSVHYWLIHFVYYRILNLKIYGKFCKIETAIRRPCNNYFHRYYPKKKTKLQLFMNWFGYDGIWIILKFLPFELLIGCFIYDCIFHNYIIIHYFYILPIVPIYMLFVKLINFYYTQDSDELIDIPSELYNIEYYDYKKRLENEKLNWYWFFYYFSEK